MRKCLPEKKEQGKILSRNPEALLLRVRTVHHLQRPATPVRFLRCVRQKKSVAGMEVCVIKPRSMEDTREITDTLLASCTVVLNMEGLDVDIAQRIIDFASGSCYAIDGNLQKVSNFIFIITPSGVEVSGDFQEILNGVDMPSLGNKF